MTAAEAERIRIEPQASSPAPRPGFCAFTLRGCGACVPSRPVPSLCPGPDRGPAGLAPAARRSRPRRGQVQGGAVCGTWGRICSSFQASHGPGVGRVFSRLGGRILLPDAQPEPSCLPAPALLPVPRIHPWGPGAAITCWARLRRRKTSPKPTSFSVRSRLVLEETKTNLKKIKSSVFLLPRNCSQEQLPGLAPKCPGQRGLAAAAPRRDAPFGRRCDARSPSSARGCKEKAQRLLLDQPVRRGLGFLWLSPPFFK